MCSFKERTVNTSLQKRHSIITFYIKEIYLYLAEIQLKIKVQRQSRDESLESRAIVVSNKKHNSTCKRTILLGHYIRQEQSRTKNVPDCNSTTDLCDKRKYFKISSL